MQGLWEYTDDISALVTYTTLSDMFSNPERKTGTLYAVFDVARGGNDQAIANIFDGWHSLERLEIPKTDDPQALRESVREILVNRNIAYQNAIYDDNGIGWALGGGELKGMRQFVGSRSPIPTKVQIITKKKNPLDPDGAPPNFINLKSQCGFYLANKINNHEISVTDNGDKDIIIEDLTALLVEKDIEKEGKQQLRPKEDVKTDLGRSPDNGDTFIMRAWFDLFEAAVGDSDEDAERVSSFYKKLELKKNGFIRQNKDSKPRAGLR
jgi:hypothetical protein